jgi:hypothetical protein
VGTGDWKFIGTIRFTGFWDFNTGGGNRSPIAEAKVILASALLPGRPFHIDSVPVPAYQIQSDVEMQWDAATPVRAPDSLGRGALDMGIGGNVGGGADLIGLEAGDGGVDVGAESGAQSNADL